VVSTSPTTVSPTPAPPSTAGMDIFAVTSGSQCAEALPYGPNAISASQTSAYVSTLYGNVRHQTWLQVVDPGDGTPTMYITWNFGSWATIAERFYSAVNGGIPVNWTVIYGSQTITKSGQWWWSDQGANYNTLFASTTSGSSFSPDDGLWGAGSGVVNGDHGLPSDFWGVGNLDGWDGQCQYLYTGSSSYTTKPSVVNRMYVEVVSTAPTSSPTTTHPTR
jgi:hypothetical protein